VNVNVRYGNKVVTKVIGFPQHQCASCGHKDEYHLGYGCYYMMHSRKVGGYACYCPCFFDESLEDYDQKLTFINRMEDERNRELD